MNNEVLIPRVLSVRQWDCTDHQKCCPVGRVALVLRCFRWYILHWICPLLVTCTGVFSGRETWRRDHFGNIGDGRWI